MQRPASRTKLLRLFASLVAGCFVPLSFAPFDFWFVGILSIVIFLYCIDGMETRQIALSFYFYYVGMFAVGVSWIYVSINIYGGAEPLLAGFLIIFFVMAWSLTGLLHGYFYGRFVSGLSFGILLGFPSLWVLSEAFRAWIFTGFPWLFFGYGHLDTSLAGYGPIAGIYGVSFMALLTAALVFSFLQSRKIPYAVATLVIWVAGYGLSQVSFVKEEKEITLAAVQGNIDQHSKWRRDMVLPILEKYRDLTESLWGTDLIVWPEAAITVFRENADFFLNEMDSRGKQKGSTLLLGIPDRDLDGNYYNTAIAIGQGGGSYVKRHLVPFGEYVPLEGLLRGLIGFFDLPMSHNRPGADKQAAPLAGDLRLSLSICYEVVYPELVRSTVTSPDLLVTISNDTWFGSSIGPAQHLQMARMRALENGRYLLRATNNGLTVLVDHKGRIIQSLPQFEAAIMTATAMIMSGVTPFHRFGQTPILILCAMMLAILRYLPMIRLKETG